MSRKPARGFEMQNGLVVLDRSASISSPVETRHGLDVVRSAGRRPPSDGLGTLERAATETVRNPVGSGWRFALPSLPGSRVTLREVWAGDARALVSVLDRDELARIIAPHPVTREGLTRFVAWAHTERAAGRLACFAMVPVGCRQAVGLLLVRRADGESETAEWTFVLAPVFRGTGVFQEAAALAAGFAFRTLEIHRLEARAVTGSGRANGALRKLGAVHEGVLRQSLRVGSQFVDQNLWALVREDWRCYRENDNWTSHVR